MAYVKILKLGEYRAIFDLATQFKGDISVKMSALKVIEKISKAANELATVGKKKEKQLPEEITVEFDKSELEGYWKGIVDYVSDNSTTMDKILVVRSIAQVLGMSNRFSRLESEIVVTEDPIPLD